ncbi:F-box protein [Corchorus olitorius]|uniref:F-box protein n=1 Tax=Corchorus olitorius TaxID=93759 RepID=A0A1R3HFR0_9ROSI|nr:F-box protein [Corchorus olitorius]
MAALPVKSTVRFRCLSKSWQAFLTSPCFINKHLIQNKTKSQRLMVSGETFGLIKQEANKKIELEFPLKSPKENKIF